MPAVPSLDAHVDVPLHIHHWHARQFNTSSSSNSGVTTAIVVVCVVFGIVLFVSLAACMKRAHDASSVVPRPVVRAPPDSRQGPVIAEILAGRQADLPQAMDPPSQHGQTNDPPLMNQNDRLRSVIIHQDGGQVPVVDEDEPVEMPPPYLSIPFQ